LNDAVAIVLASTVVESEHSADLSSSERFWNGIGRFLVTFLGSAGEPETDVVVDHGISNMFNFPNICFIKIGGSPGCIELIGCVFKPS